MDTQKTINEIIELLNALWEKHPTNNQANVDAKEALRVRIEGLQQNKTSEDISLKGWIELGDIFLSEKKDWLAKKSQLEKDLKEEKETKEAKEQELKQAKEAIAEKLTPDLVSKLESLDQKEIKTLLTEFIDKEKKQAQIDYKKLSEEIAKQPKETNYWSIGGCVLAGLAVIVATVSLFFKSKDQK